MFTVNENEEIFAVLTDYLNKKGLSCEEDKARGTMTFDYKLDEMNLSKAMVRLLEIDDQRVCIDFCRLSGVDEIAYHKFVK